MKGRAKNMGCTCTKDRAVGRIVMLEREIEELAERGCQESITGSPLHPLSNLQDLLRFFAGQQQRLSKAADLQG